MERDFDTRSSTATIVGWSVLLLPIPLWFLSLSTNLPFIALPFALVTASVIMGAAHHAQRAAQRGVRRARIVRRAVVMGVVVAALLGLVSAFIRSTTISMFWRIDDSIAALGFVVYCAAYGGIVAHILAVASWRAGVNLPQDPAAAIRAPLTTIASNAHTRSIFSEVIMHRFVVVVALFWWVVLFSANLGWQRPLLLVAVLFGGGWLATMCAPHLLLPHRKESRSPGALHGRGVLLGAALGVIVGSLWGAILSFPRSIDSLAPDSWWAPILTPMISGAVLGLLAGACAAAFALSAGFNRLADEAVAPPVLANPTAP